MCNDLLINLISYYIGCLISYKKLYKSFDLICGHAKNTAKETPKTKQNANIPIFYNVITPTMNTNPSPIGSL